LTVSGRDVNDGHYTATTTTTTTLPPTTYFIFFWYCNEYSSYIESEWNGMHLQIVVLVLQQILLPMADGRWHAKR
jgi:hypothetical protein